MLLLVLLSKEFAWHMHEIELSIPCLLYSTHHIVSHTSVFKNCYQVHYMVANRKILAETLIYKTDDVRQ